MALLSSLVSQHVLAAKSYPPLIVPVWPWCWLLTPTCVHHTPIKPSHINKGSRAWSHQRGFRKLLGNSHLRIIKGIRLLFFESHHIKTNHLLRSNPVSSQYFCCSYGVRAQTRWQWLARNSDRGAGRTPSTYFSCQLRCCSLW